MAAVDTKEPAPLNLSAKSTPFQFNAASPIFVPKTNSATKSSFDLNNLPSASRNGSTGKKLTFYSPSQFYPTQNPYYYTGGYAPDGVYYGGYTAPTNTAAGETDTILDTVVFKNLPFSMTDDMLMKETVKVVGACVDSVTRVTDKKGRFKGTAFVKFFSVEDADGAMVKMTGVMIMGRPVKLEYMRAQGIKKKKKKRKKKIPLHTNKNASQIPLHTNKNASPSKPSKCSTPETTELVPAEAYEGAVRKVRVKSRGNSDIDMNWRSKTMESIDMPKDRESRAVCQKLVEYKNSPTNLATMITVRSVDQLKELIRVSKLLNLSHQIEEVTGEQWKVKFTRKSFFENLSRSSKGDRRFRSWSSDKSPSLSRGARGVKKSDSDSSFRQRHRTRTFSRDRTFTMRDRSQSLGIQKKERSESMVLYARGPDGTGGFKAAGRGARV